MELRHLRYFLAIAELNNLSRAAETMYVAQSTLSHALHQLEEELGAALFDRIGRSIRLTQAGRIFRDYAARACNEAMHAKRAVQELKALEAGTFTLGAIPVFPLAFLPDAVATFNQRYPKVRISVRDLLAAELEDNLALGALDLGIAFHPASRDDVESEYLFTERLVLAVGRSHPLAKKHRIQWKALDSIPLALLTSRFSTRILIEETFRNVGAHLAVAVEMDTAESLLAVAAQGQLAAIVPESAGARFEHVNLLRITGPELSRDLGLLWSNRTGRTRAASMFADMLRSLSTEPADRSPP
ncbi:LysR substrate-binding domain-containing protein [Burkholderia sp. Ac-20349]|uniref:LysR substrate-binding domain-containing protein n=1 Tax=Burkholderia sp. Ac-20349 TaxID=2703893 RepID=UPI00197C1629|nr:LysR substrate-binding domain-containing protein [Burkholderia sp. Ac-20349]MBN3841901.1 LysR family transcriptional regulator [Burkholderia sp. Ac-20349]